MIAAAVVAVVAALTVIVGFSGAASAQTCPSGSSATTTTTAGGGGGTTTTTRPSGSASANARVTGQAGDGAVVASFAAAPSQTCPAKTGANMVLPLAGGAGAIAVVLAVRRVLSARSLA